jgi:O-antigen/teichoic acid export membrane protein
MAGVVVSNLLAYVFHFVAGRKLGPAEYGAFGALMALFILAGIPVSILGSAITKFTSRYHSEGKLGIISVFRKRIMKITLILSSMLLMGFTIMASPIASFLKIDSPDSIIIVGITLSIAVLLPINRGILQGMKKFAILTWNSILEASSRLAFLVVLLYLGYGVKGAVLAYGLAYFISFLLVFPYIRETRVEVTDFQEIQMTQIYKFIFMVFLVNIFIQGLINLPSLFVKHNYTEEFTGYWTAALTIARTSLFVSGAISLVMFPEISREKDILIRKKYFYKATILALAGLSAMAFVQFVIPEFIIQILYGPAYIGAAPILQWMGFVMIFIGLIQLRADYFLAKLK